MFGKNKNTSVHRESPKEVEKVDLKTGEVFEEQEEAVEEEKLDELDLMESVIAELKKFRDGKTSTLAMTYGYLEKLELIQAAQSDESDS